MKTTGDDTRMIEVAPGECVHVRGPNILLTFPTPSANTLKQIKYLAGKRVLVVELVEVQDGR